MRTQTSALRLRCSSLLLAVMAWLAPALRAEAAPTTIGYGGRLTDASGAPVAGPVDLSVQFYGAVTGGSGLLARPLDFSGTTLANGVFQLPLALTPAQVDAVFGDGTAPVFVGVTDVTHHRTYPRQALLAVPLALRVPVDGTSVVYDGSGKLSVGAVDAAKVTGLTTMLAGMGDAAKLQGVPLDTGTPAAGAVLKYVGGQWQAAAGDSVSGNFGIGTTSAQTALDVAGVLTQRGAAAPGVAPAGEGRIYYDSSSNQFMVSQNGGAYAPLGTVSGGTITQISAGAGLTGGGTSGNVTVGLAGVGTAGTYTKVWTDAYGRVTAGGTLTAADLPTIPAGLISGALPVSQISGTLAAAQVAAIPATQIQGGTLATALIPQLAATQISSGTLAAAQLPALSAAEVTSGTLAVALGGTGVTSFPAGGVVVGAGSLPLSTVSTTSQYQVLQQGASGPVFGAVELGQASAVSGTLAVAHLPAIPATMVTGSLAATQISGTLAAAQVGPIPVTQLTGTLGVAQVGAIPVTQLTGTLAAAQIGAIPVTQLTGTLGATQVGAIPMTQLSGTLAANQVAAPGASGQVLFNGGATPSTDANLFWDNATKRLGIGTATPSRTLEVSVTGTTGPHVRFTNPSATSKNAALEFYAGVTPAQVWALGPDASGSGDANLYFYDSNGNLRMSLGQNGNVGIGTPTPTARLQVAASDSAGIEVVSGATNGVRLGADASQGYVQAVDATGFGTYKPLNVGGSTIDLTVAGFAKAHVDATGLGIGTTSAASALHAQGNGSAPSLSGSHSGSLLLTDGSGVIDAGFVSSAPYGWLQTRHLTLDGYSYNLALNPLGGNVGIGTTSPNPEAVGSWAPVVTVGPGGSGKVGVIELQGTQTSDAAVGAAVFRNTAIAGTNTRIAQIHANRSGADDAGKMIFSTRASGGALTGWMALDPSGYLGIGAIAPGARLDVTEGGSGKFSTAGDEFKYDGGAGVHLGAGGWANANVIAANTGVTAATRNTDGLILTATRGAEAYARSAMKLRGDGTGGIAFYTGVGTGAPTQQVTIDAAGNVGVGSTTPAAKLDVNGDLKIADAGTCSTIADKGRVRYNSATNVLQFCNGTAWSNAGGPLTCETQSCNTSGCTASCSAGYTLTAAICAAGEAAQSAMRVCAAVTNTSATVVAGDYYAWIRCCKL